MVDNSDRNSMEHRSAHTACRVFKGGLGLLPPTSASCLMGPGGIARDVLLEIVSLTFSHLYSLLCFLFCLFDFLPEL